MLGLGFSFGATPAAGVSADIVISQVYGGGGNVGATYRNDFIELFNLGPSAVNVTGWSVQYAATAGTNWQKTDLTGWIKPGRDYLIQSLTLRSGQLITFLSMRNKTSITIAAASSALVHFQLS